MAPIHPPPSPNIQAIPPPHPSHIPRLQSIVCDPTFPKNLPHHSGQSPPAELHPIPSQFFLALEIRYAVFAIEQKCSPVYEVDDDDARSMHWVVFAREDEGKEEIPAATIRLIPWNPDEHAHDHDPASSTADEQKEKAAPATQSPLWTTPSYPSSKIWDQQEPYVTIGRLATLAPFRGRSYARLLIDAAIEYAQQHPEQCTKPFPAPDYTVCKGGLPTVIYSKGRKVEDVSPGAPTEEIEAAVKKQKEEARATEEEEERAAGKEENNEAKWNGLISAHAQKVLVPWYEKRGFEVDEGMGTWREGGIEHVGIWKRVDIRK